MAILVLLLHVSLTAKIARSSSKARLQTWRAPGQLVQ
jgi:hypothetical protein